MIKTGSDFSGVGAFDQALRKLGIDYQTVYACDWDKYARQTYIENYGNPKYFPKDVYEREIPEESLDIYMTSPPCQAFSLAGKRKGEDDDRGILFYNSHEFIQKNNPRYFIFENVRGLLSDANGLTFKVWLDMLGGKSVNGNPVLFPNEKSTPYHIYWQVLNAKHYGVPQNRERVFIIGIRDDADNTFRFPKTQHLTKKLKDVLEDNVEDKYFLSEKMINGFSNHKERHEQKGTGFKWQPKTKEDIANCLRANAALYPTDNTIIVTNNKRVNQNYNKHKNTIEKGDFMDSYNQTIHKEVTPTITSRITGSNNYHIYEGKENNVIVHNIPQIVSVRKHKVDVKKLQELLKKHKNISNQKIAKKLNIKKTTVDHWFRTDNGFSIPEPNIWQDLKNLLEIKTNQFDKSITEFETREGVYEKANRVYDTKGIAPTMTSTSADERILINKVVQLNQCKESGGKQPYQQNRLYDINGINPALNAGQSAWGGNIINTKQIRRLTPRECFRLMDFPDTFKWSVSDTQAYKQAGNSIVVNVLAEIINKLNL